MALTERLALIIDAKTGGAVRDLRQVQREVGALEQPVTRTDKALTALGLSGVASGQALRAGLGTAAVAGAFGLGQLAQEAVSAASALNEQASAAEIQFGSAADAVKGFASDAAGSIGLSERAALQASNTFGTFFTNLGIGNEEAAKFSTGLTALASDLASFKDIPIDESILKLTSGLAGEQEALRRLGIFISEAGVKARAAELGFKPLNGLFSDQAKVLARLSLILEQTGKAQGNFALTAGDLANRQRTLGAEIENVSAALGESLTPAVTNAIDDLSRLARGVQDVGGFFGDINDALGGIPGDILGNLGSHNIYELGRSTDDAGNEAKEARSDFAALGNVLLGVADSVQETTPSLDELAEGVNDVRSAFFASVDAQDSFNNALERIDAAGRDAARAHEELAEAQKDQRQAIADLNVEVERNERAVTRAARAVTNAQRDLAEANEDLADAQANYGSVLADFHPNSRRAHEALEDLEDAERRQEDAQFNAEDAAYGLQDAQQQLAATTQELRDELNGVGPAADRVRDAQDRVSESSDGLREAQSDLAREAINLEVALANERDTLAENNDELEAFIGWLDMLKAKYPEMDGFFAGMIWRAAELRGELEETSRVLEAIGLLPGLGGGGHPLAGNPLAPLFPHLLPQQPQGKSGFRDINVTMRSDADPLHVAREIKRQLMPGG